MLKVFRMKHFVMRQPLVAYALFFIVPDLKDILGELPRREASVFRSQVSSLIIVLHLIITSPAVEKFSFMSSAFLLIH